MFMRQETFWTYLSNTTRDVPEPVCSRRRKNVQYNEYNAHS